MSVLVTGGAGYIGSHVVAALLEAGEKVVVIDDLSTGRSEAVEGAELVVADIRDTELVRKVMQTARVEAVIHMAASIKVGESVALPLRYYGNNVANTMGLLEAMIEVGVGHLIFSSSAAVYGAPTITPVSESHPTNPINPYGRSKLVSELMIEDVGKAHGLGYISLRYFNAAGAHPGGHLGYTLEEDPSHLLRAAFRAAYQGDKFSIFGTDYSTPDGTCVRDFVHVWDLAIAHVFALQHLRRGGKSGAFNCGYGKGNSVKEVVDAVRRVTGTPLLVDHAPRRAGDPAAIVADAKLIREELGWKPQFDNLDEMIHHQMAWEKRIRK